MPISRRSFIGTGLVAAALPAYLSHAESEAHFSPHELWYSAPAARWLEALPLGNGRMGAMVFGGTEMERISLSEPTAWSGAPEAGTVNPDREFLRARAYPVLRELAEFFLAYMVHEPSHGWLVTGPSDSPENWYRTPNGNHAAESMGNTCDRAFVYALLSMCMEASTILGVDADLRAKWMAAREQLPPFQAGKYGRLQEWMHDFEDADPNHRHTSHLVSLYPLQQISPTGMPALARAAEIMLERRMAAPHWEQTEWGRANLVAYYARLLQGDKAYSYLTGIVAKAAEDNLLTYSSGGVAGAQQNIFALDGNTASTAAIAEMLLQSQNSEIVLLPALPAAWPNGSVRGLCARGGYEVNIQWRGGRLDYVSIRNESGGSVPVRYQNLVKIVHVLSGKALELHLQDFSRNTT